MIYKSPNIYSECMNLMNDPILPIFESQNLDIEVLTEASIKDFF